jgi:hypothetical protein
LIEKVKVGGSFVGGGRGSGVRERVDNLEEGLVKIVNRVLRAEQALEGVEGRLGKIASANLQNAKADSGIDTLRL